MNFRLRRPIPWFKIMKITFSQILIAVVLSSFAYASPVRAQNILDIPVNISLNNTPLLDVVNYLQKKNNIKFIYSKKTVDMSQKVNANFKEQPLKVVLDELFKNNGIDYEVLQDRIVLGKLPADMLPVNAYGSPNNKDNSAAEASIAVTGKVVDAQGQPIPGATVTEKGTTNGVLTDANGTFKLNVASQSSVLVVSFVGYKKEEVPVGGNTTFTVTLLDDVSC